MKRFIIIAMLTAIMPLAAMAQHEEDTENGVVSLAGREGFTIETKKGDFVFKPYLLVQTSANFNWYDDEGLDKAYNQDNIANSGFSVPYAVLGFTGKAFDKVSFNLSINAAASGGALLQQAWFDVQLKKQFAIRVGKFKTPFSHAYLTTLGETLLPSLPVSLTAPVILPYSLNAVTPNIGTGFDLGVEIHGLVADKFGYEIGLFNGTGAAVNTATKTFSDDWHIPSLLYAGRFTYMPKGVMPATQGNPNRLNEDKIMFGISTSINVESENESTNDYRAGLEFAMLKNKLYLGAEVYYMNVGFTKRQKISESYNYLGGYVQGGYFVAPRLTSNYTLSDVAYVKLHTSVYKENQELDSLKESATKFFKYLDKSPVFDKDVREGIANYSNFLLGSKAHGIKSKKELVAFLHEEDRHFRTFLANIDECSSMGMTEITNNTADICSNIYKAASEGILPTSETLVLMSMRTDRRLILNAQVCHDVLKRGKIKSANQANAYLWMMLQPYLSMDALAIAMLTLQQIQAMTDIAKDYPAIITRMEGKHFVNKDVSNKIPAQLMRLYISTI